MNPSDPIAIFDSGFGGLTVVRALRQLLPNENLIYFGDTARVPYGEKSPETIRRYARENASFLITMRIKLLIIACNTVCTCALEELRGAFPLPIIGISEQGVDAIVKQSNTNKVIVLGTRATIASNVYQREISKRLPHAEIKAMPCPLWVPLVEEGYIEHPLTKMAVNTYLHAFRDQTPYSVLLGCTHFPLLQSQIQKELGDDVPLVDPAPFCALEAKRVLTQDHLLNQTSGLARHQFFVTDDPEKFRLLGKIFLNYPIDNITLV